MENVVETTMENNEQKPRNSLIKQNPDRALVLRGRLFIFVILIAIPIIRAMHFIEHWIVCCFWTPYLWPMIIAGVLSIGYFYGMTWAKWALLGTTIWLLIQQLQGIIIDQQGFINWSTMTFSILNLVLSILLLYAMLVNKSTKAFTEEQNNIYEPKF